MNKSWVQILEWFRAAVALDVFPPEKNAEIKIAFDPSSWFTHSLLQIAFPSQLLIITLCATCRHLFALLKDDYKRTLHDSQYEISMNAPNKSKTKATPAKRSVKGVPLSLV